MALPVFSANSHVSVYQCKLTDSVTKSDVTLNSTENDVKFSPDFIPCHISLHTRVVFVTISILMVICGVVGNSLFLKIIYKVFVKNFRRKKTIHILYLANMSLVDLLALGYWYMFFVIDLILNRQPVVNDTHCKINGVVIVVLYIASILFLVTITVNRYLHVCHNDLYQRIFTLPRTVAWSLVVWLTGLCIALLPVMDGLDSTEYHYNPFTRFCSYSRIGFTYMKVIITAWAFFPVLFLAYCNYAIFHFWSKAQNASTILHKTEKTKLQRVLPRLRNYRRGVQIDTQEDITRPRDTTLDVQTLTVTESIPCTDSQGTGKDSTIRNTRRPSRESDGKKASELTIARYGAVLSSSTASEENKTPHRLDSYTSTDSEGKPEKKIPVKPASLENKDSCVDNQGTGTPQRSQSRTSRKSTADKKFNVNQGNFKSIAEKSVIDDKGMDGCPEAECQQMQGQDAEKSKDDQPPESPGDVQVAGTPLPPAMTKPTDSPPGPSSLRLHKEQDGNQLPKNKESTSREKAFVRSLLVVCLSTMLTHIPYNATSLLGTYFSLSPEIVIMGNLFLYLHHSVNWILYGFMNPAFRREYIQFADCFFGRCHRMRVVHEGVCTWS